MQIGDYKITAINSGYLKLDGGAMFGIIPRPLWEKTNPYEDTDNRRRYKRDISRKSCPGKET